jgi:hypothetical protein
VSSEDIGEVNIALVVWSFEYVRVNYRGVAGRNLSEGLHGPRRCMAGAVGIGWPELFIRF